ncbi:MAG TPA: 4Fe-4S dicluster domain-containing protein [Bacillota bacterium]|nr:4Fe-4S dicluster domain-containing protein [Bacillota bacterium]
MSRELVIKPGLCIGCTTCSLTCSITWGEDFDVNRSYVKVGKDDKHGLFTIAFSSECRNCKKCGETCPSGALRVVELEDKEGKGA